MLAAALGFLAISIKVEMKGETKKYKTISNEQATEMLAIAETDIKDHYYDPNLNGLNIEQRFSKAKQEIQAAKSQDEALLDIAGAIAALRDSHTRLIPPTRPYGVDYGWVHEPVGDACCYVIAVRPDSDAFQKGLREGDRIEGINGLTVTRQNIESIDYSYSVFPQSGLHLRVRSPQGTERQIVAMAKVIPGQEVIRGIDVREWLRASHGEKDRSRYYSVGTSTLVWQLPDFLINPAEVDDLCHRARPYATLILDLRRNSGGVEESMLKLVGNFFEDEVHIGVRKGRSDSIPLIAKSRGSKAFKGKLIVLIDSRSASASEILARVIQIEKRGIVLGDRSAGAVGEAQDYVHAVKLDASNVTQYRIRVTVRQLLMKDGKSLENEGVVPDEIVVPTENDLAAGTDPVLARALQIAGTEITPNAAGKILPFIWPKEHMPEMN